MKFRYSVKVVDGLWYTTDREIHPIRQKWLRPMASSGNDVFDSLIAEYGMNLPGPVLETESVTVVTDHKKDKTDTEHRRTYYTDMQQVESGELDKLFSQPECSSMSDSQIRGKVKLLFKENRLAL